MKRAWVALVVLGVVGCKDKAKDLRPADKGSAASAPVATDKPPAKVDGPAVTPVITSSITFFVPKDAPWWGEMAFGCYAGAITLQPGNTPSAPFTKISPAVEPAMRAADIDLDKDLGAIGAWGCGDGPCVYVALTLRHPEKLKDLLTTLVPGATPKELGKNHYTVDAPGAQGARTIHMQAVPIQWPARLPADTWSRQAAAATHVIFITGLFGKGSEVTDALAAGADPQSAAARVADVESLVPDAHGRCVLGHVGKRDFQPGYKLTSSRFVLAAPEGKGDPLTQMLGSLRTLDLEVELVLDPAPNEKKVADWIAQARAWLSAIGDQVRAGFGGGGPMVDAMYDMAGLLGKSGFRHTLKDKSLTLSFRTDRISSAELATVETQLEGAMKAQGISP
jgi:hypothetical protein